MFSQTSRARGMAAPMACRSIRSSLFNLPCTVLCTHEYTSATIVGVTRGFETCGTAWMTREGRHAGRRVHRTQAIDRRAARFWGSQTEPTHSACSRRRMACRLCDLEINTSVGCLNQDCGALLFSMLMATDKSRVSPAVGSAPRDRTRRPARARVGTGPTYTPRPRLHPPCVFREGKPA